ncbi:MAG: FtsB family cell division protein [Frankiaceae bacterium]
MLALVLCALVVMLADPLQAYLGQRSRIAQARAANSALQRHVDALEAQQRLWSDPNFVRQQARERLYYVMPGETPYVVVGGPAASHPQPARPPGSTAATGTSGASGSWYGRLWDSVRTAGAGR